MKKILLGGLSLLVLLIGFMAARTIMHGPIAREGVVATDIKVDSAKIARHMSEAIKFRTVSFGNKALPKQEFEGFIRWIKSTYPEVFAEMEFRRIGGYTLLLKWVGSDPDLKPILLTAHYDVVPVIPGTESLWTQAPFSGAITEDSVWGRGALDDKSAVITQLEAATLLLKEGFQPQRSIYFSFGHDEELGGADGASKVADYLKDNNVQFLWSLDEGSFLFKGMVPGVERTLGTINVAEKGSVTLEIIAKGAGGHSSMPPQQTAVGLLANAIVKLEANPVPGGLVGLSAEMFDTASRYMAFPMRFMFANQWLFRGMIEKQLSQSNATNAMLRTTTAPTMLSASVKSNVLAINAIATVNFRVHPRDSIEDIVNHVKAIVGSDNIEVRIKDGSGSAASEISSTETAGYKVIEQSVYETNSEAIMSAGLMVAASDSRSYARVSDDSYRFNPMLVTSEDLTTFHGTNERISIDNLVAATQTYNRIIVNGSKP